MRVLVTGGAGFIGANLVRGLRDSPAVDSIAVLDDLSTGHRQNLEGMDGIEVHEGSILDADALAGAVRGCDAIVHLAARPSVPRSIDNPVASHEANATGTLRVLEAARTLGNPHVVVASSSSVYGANPALPKHEDLAPRPLSPYAASKLAAESYALAYATCFGLGVLAFRFFNVFGPLQDPDHAYAAVVPRFLSAAVAGRPLTVHGDGKQTRDFTAVGTVTRVIADALERRVTAPGPVNLAYGNRVPLVELVERIEHALGARVAVEHTEPRAGDVRDSQADSSRLRELFPHVTPVSLDDGLAATVDWFRQGRPRPLR
ncbi:MAG: NAD-dependent epimerase/dehydratase family protein [Acidimicrobiia bacterium]